MTHQHTLIRHAVHAALKADVALVALVGDRVWRTRAKPIKPGRLPAVAVYTPADKATASSYGGDGQGPVERDLVVAIEIVADATDDEEELLDDTLDSIAAAVETVLDGFDVPNLLSARLRYQKTESDVFDRGETSIGARLLTYACRFDTPSRERSGIEAAATTPITGTLPLALPAGIDRVLSVVVVGRPDLQPLDRWMDWQVTDGVLDRLPEGMLPEGAEVRVVVALPVSGARPDGVFLGQAPEIGAAHADDYDQVHP